MNINADPGGRVRFTGEGAYPSERERALSILSIGAIYTVDEIEVWPSRSYVHLEEHPSRSFNTIMFEDVPEWDQPHPPAPARVEQPASEGGECCDVCKVVLEWPTDGDPTDTMEVSKCRHHIRVKPTPPATGEAAKTEGGGAVDEPRHIFPSSFSIRDPERPCSAWSSGAHIISRGECRCGLRIILLAMREPKL